MTPPVDPASYDSGWPSYPREAVTWLLGNASGLHVLELGAGTGKLTHRLLQTGQHVLATDSDVTMLQLLRRRHPTCRTANARAEQLPLRDAAVDAVIAGHAFHLFDRARCLAEAARVLVPGGTFALAWNVRDERVPWVRKLGDLIGQPPALDPTEALAASQLFESVEQETFRFWQPMDHQQIRDLAATVDEVSSRSPAEREAVLERVSSLCGDYQRGPDGLLMPYVTHCFRATVRPGAPGNQTDTRSPGDDGDALQLFTLS